MNKYEVGDIITLDKGEEYLVVDYFPLNNNYYLYVISTDGKNETIIFKRIDDTVIKVDNKEEFNNALAEIIKRNKDEIDELMNESNTD